MNRASEVINVPSTKCDCLSETKGITFSQPYPGRIGCSLGCYRKRLAKLTLCG